MDSYHHRTGTFSNSRGVEIFYQCWTVDQPRGAVLLVHGLGEHSGRYGNLISALAGSRISFFAPDHQGHGRSGGKRGHIDDFADYRADIKQFADQIVKPQTPDIPLICLGHSMGGLIAAGFALDHQKDLTALILSAPAFIPGGEVPAIQVKAARIISRLLPRLTRSNQLDPGDLSHDRQTVDAYLADPLVHDRISTRWFVSFLAEADRCLARAPELTLPLLVIQGEADKIVSLDGSRAFHHEAGSADKSLEVFDGLFHETMNEKQPDRKRVLETIAGWLLKFC